MNERERIKYIIDNSGLSLSQFADKTGIPRASVSHILGGRNKPSLDIFQKVAAVFQDVDTRWLMLGIGEAPHIPVLRDNSDDSAASLFATTAANQSPDIQEVPREPLSFDVSSQNQRSFSLNEDAQKLQKPMVNKTQQSERMQRKNTQTRLVQSTTRKIKEVRVFYNDGTYEILYPEK